MGKQSGRISKLEADLKQARRLNAILGILCVFLVVVLVAQLAINSGNDDDRQNASERKAPDGYDLRNPDDPMAIGDADAPVVMTWWTDMRCPFCGVFGRERLPILQSKYVEKGTLRIVVRDAPLFGEKSTQGAIAARAAGRQGKFIDFVQAVYQSAPPDSKPDLPLDTLVKYAKQAGVADLDQFRRDLSDPLLAQEVNNSLTSARQLGVQSVPAFTIDDRSLAGAQPIEVFQRLIDQAATDAGAS